MNLRNYFEKNRMTIQIVYGVVLIVLIPLLIVFNTVFIIRKYNSVLDVTLQRQALSLGKAIAALIENDLPWADFVQIKIEALMEGNESLLSIDVLKPDNGNFRVSASTDKKKIGKLSEFYLYKLAWSQSLNEGLAAYSDKIGDGAEEGVDQERYWLVAMPMNGSDGTRQALVSVKISSKLVNDLTQENRNISIYILIGTVLIVVLFLLVAVRLWDYALLYRKIKEVDQMKDEFISIASHELRTPVTGIRGFAAMIVDGSLGAVNDKVKKSVTMILGASDRLANLVEDLLNVSRIEQNRIKMVPANFDAAHVINEVVHELKIQADEKKLSLDIKQDTKLLPIINGDVDRFKQVLINLIGNAIKYTEKGGVEIILREKNNSNILEIAIKDTGIGMASKDMDRLFQKFYRVQTDKTKNIVGSGLGLYITKRLVEMMGGEIRAESMEGVGSQFLISFSIVKS